MVVAGKAKVGPILGIVGGTILTIGGLLLFGYPTIIEVLIYPATLADMGIDATLLMIPAILTLVYGLLGLIGAILGLVGKKIGVFLMLIFGILACVTMFITIPNGTVMQPLSGAGFFVDPFLLLLGGILGLALKE